MEITWVKDSFSMYEINILSKEILKQTTNTLYSPEKKQFYCKNAKDIDIIYEILDKYKEYIYQPPLPDFNIIEQSILNFVIKQFSATCLSPSRVPTPWLRCLIRHSQKSAHVPYREFLFGQLNKTPEWIDYN